MNDFYLDDFGHNKAYNKASLNISSLPQGFTGLVVKFWPNGEIFLQRMYLRGKSNGPMKSWFSNGALAVEGFYRQGLIDSVWTFYNKDNKKTHEKRYKNSRLLSEKKFYLSKKQSKEVPLITIKNGISKGGISTQSTVEDLKKMFQNIKAPEKETSSDNGMNLKKLMEKVDDDPEFLKSTGLINHNFDRGSEIYYGDEDDFLY